MRRLLLVLALLAPLSALAAPAPGPVLLWEQATPWPALSLVASETGVGVVGSDQGTWVQAYDLATGRRMWQRSAGAGAWSPPTVRGASVYLVPHARTLLALRLESGDLLWWQGPRFPRSDPALPGLADTPPPNRASPVVHLEQVITMSMDGVVTVLSSAGTLIRQADLMPGRLDADEFWATPAVLEERLYAATVAGRLWMLPLDRPEAATRRALVPAERRGLGTAAREVRAPLLAFKDRVYLSTMDGTVHCVAAPMEGPEATWRRPLGPPGRYHATPGGLALAELVPDPGGDPALYVSLLDRVVKLDAPSGGVLWTRRLPGETVTSRPALWRDLALVGLADGRLAALDRGTGEPRWTLRLPGPPTAGPTVWQDLALVGLADGRVQCYDLAPAEPSASSSPAAMRMPR